MWAVVHERSRISNNEIVFIATFCFLNYWLVPAHYFNSLFFVDRKASKLSDLLPRCSTLSEDVVTISNAELGEGTLGVVYKGFYSPLNVNCAIKFGKNDKCVDIYLEAEILQLLQSSRYFPRAFGIFKNKFVLKYAHSEKKGRHCPLKKNNPVYQMSCATEFVIS